MSDEMKREMYRKDYMEIVKLFTTFQPSEQHWAFYLAGREASDSVSEYKCIHENYSLALESNITSLKQREARLVEVVKFYSANHNWFCSRDDQFGDSIDYVDLEENSPITKRRFVGGKRARETLKQLEIEL